MPSLITGEVNGYYSDFGSLEHLRRAFSQAYVYTGQYSKHRKKPFVKFPIRNHHRQFIVFSQNDDHTGNRLRGERLTKLVSFENVKLSAALVILSPGIPLLFMGEEYGEENPFLFFTDFTDSVLNEQVKEGRKKEFAYFNVDGEAPDPTDKKNYDQSKLNWSLLTTDYKQNLFHFYKKLIAVRKNTIIGSKLNIGDVKVEMDEHKKILMVQQDFSNGKKSIVPDNKFWRATCFLCSNKYDRCQPCLKFGVV